jgi:hypothetical protein
MLNPYPSNYKKEKQFGYFVGDFFYLHNEPEVKRIHHFYNKFYAAKQIKASHQKKDSMLSV